MQMILQKSEKNSKGIMDLCVAGSEFCLLDRELVAQNEAIRAEAQ